MITNRAQLNSFGRRHWQITAVLAVVASIYFTWTWTDQIGSLSSDAPAYLIMARHYSGESGRPDAAPVAALAGALNHFPPLYPIALARLHAVDNLYRVHLVTTAFFLLALLALYGWMCEAGLRASEAALLSLLFAALPGCWLLVLSPQSEFLYLLCSCLALLFLSMYEGGRGDQILYAAALAVAASILTRTIGIALLGPLLIAALRAPWRKGVLALLIALTPMVFWHLLHRSAAGYVDSLNQYYRDGAALPFTDQLKTEFLALRAGLESNLAQDYESRGIVGLLGAVLLLAAAYRAAKLSSDGVYLAAYLLVVLVWPFRDEGQRFLWPVLPILLAQPALFLAQFRKDARPARWLQAPMIILGVILLFLSLPVISAASERFRSADDSGIPGARGLRSWYQSDPAKAARRTAGEALAIDMLRRIGNEVPPGDCVISIRPDLINYFAGRLAAWPPRDSVPDPEFARQLHGAHCRYLFMTTASYAGYPVPLHPLPRLNEKISIIDYGEIPILAPGDGRIICVLAKFP